MREERCGVRVRDEGEGVRNKEGAVLRDEGRRMRCE